MYLMNTSDTKVTKIPKRVLNSTPTALKQKCKMLKVGDALPVNTFGWAANLKTQLEESTDFKYKYYSEPEMTFYQYRKLSDSEKKNVKIFIGRIA